MAGLPFYKDCPALGAPDITLWLEFGNWGSASIHWCMNSNVIVALQKFFWSYNSDAQRPVHQANREKGDRRFGVNLCLSLSREFTKCRPQQTASADETSHSNNHQTSQLRRQDEQRNQTATRLQQKNIQSSYINSGITWNRYTRPTSIAPRDSSLAEQHFIFNSKCTYELF